ncbi:MAG: hypothetical protein WC551_07455 [Patescibacteria group bacterium]
MLIVCSGPDTWRARKRALELLEAFKTKHDISGFSTETLKSGDFQAALNQIGAPSIFSPKRMIRCDGLLENLKIADIRKLAARLKADGESTVLLTVEDEPPTEKILEEFKGPGFFHYQYPELSGTEFLKVCQALARESGLEPSSAKEIADRCGGDIWKAVNEIGKFSANPKAPHSENESDPGSPFGAVDEYLGNRAGWMETIVALDDDQTSSLILSQTKSAIRVKDGEVVRMPPFAISKLKRLDRDILDTSFYKSLRVSVGVRTGLVGIKETETLL